MGERGKKGASSGKDERVRGVNHTDASAFCQRSCTRRNLLPCWQQLSFCWLGKQDMVPAPRCRCLSCLGRSARMPQPRGRCPAWVDKLQAAAWFCEGDGAKSRRTGHMARFSFLPVSLEDVSCAALSQGAPSCQIHDVLEEQPTLGCERGRASRWAVGARRQMPGCCAWRDGLEPGTLDTGMCWAVFLEERGRWPCRSAPFSGSGLLKLQAADLSLCSPVLRLRWVEPANFYPKLPDRSDFILFRRNLSRSPEGPCFSPSTLHKGGSLSIRG